MKLGKVIGSVVSTRKDPKLEGLKLLVIQNMTLDLKPDKGYVIAVDAVGSGASEIVLYASGSSARMTDMTKDRPVDAVVMAIVDSYDVKGEVTKLL